MRRLTHHFTLRAGRHAHACVSMLCTKRSWPRNRGHATQPLRNGAFLRDRHDWWAQPTLRRCYVGASGGHALLGRRAIRPDAFSSERHDPLVMGLVIKVVAVPARVNAAVSDDILIAAQFRQRSRP